MLLVLLENVTFCAFLARSGLSDINQWDGQSCIFNKLLLSTEAEPSTQLTTENKKVSSAKNDKS